MWYSLYLFARSRSYFCVFIHPNIITAINTDVMAKTANATILIIVGKHGYLIKTGRASPYCFNSLWSFLHSFPRVAFCKSCIISLYVRFTPLTSFSPCYCLFLPALLYFKYRTLPCPSM